MGGDRVVAACRVVGCPARSLRRQVEGIRHRTRAGCPWRDVPDRYGPWSSLYRVFRRYQRDGVWGRVLDALWTLADGGGQICGEVSVDSTIARARARCDDEDVDWSISVHTRRGALGGLHGPDVLVPRTRARPTVRHTLFVVRRRRQDRAQVRTAAARGVSQRSATATTSPCPGASSVLSGDAPPPPTSRAYAYPGDGSTTVPTGERTYSRWVQLQVRISIVSAGGAQACPVPGWCS